MAKLILVIDVQGDAKLIADDLANNGSVEVRVQGVVGRRARAVLGESAQNVVAHSFEGPSKFAVEQAYVSEEREMYVSTPMFSKRLF